MTNYIKTEKVLEIAKKYYNCSNIEGIPLENQNNNSVALWESRILLGDIMSSYKYNYHADQVISEFTLALLEDSGWYKANYYTGGLMRFGKNKGCEFFLMIALLNLKMNSVIIIPEYQVVLQVVRLLHIAVLMNMMIATIVMLK